MRTAVYCSPNESYPLSYPYGYWLSKPSPSSTSPGNPCLNSAWSHFATSSKSIFLFDCSIHIELAGSPSYPVSSAVPLESYIQIEQLHRLVVEPVLPFLRIPLSPNELKGPVVFHGAAITSLSPEAPRKETGAGVHTCQHTYIGPYENPCIAAWSSLPWSYLLGSQYYWYLCVHCWHRRMSY